jgi:hypothetical protein
MRQKWNLPVIIASILLAHLIGSTTSAVAGIPEPGIILYGKVFEAPGTLMTTGELTWTFQPTAGGTAVVVTVPLSEIVGQGGPYSYKVMIPLETAVSGYPVSANALPLSASPLEYTRTASVKDTSISRTDTVLISTASRGKAEQVTIGAGSLEDSDGDGLPDAWEQRIVNASSQDNITSINEVLPGDDFDADGESNWTEYLNGTDPTDLMSARRGDLDGDKYISLDDAILALRVVSGIDTGSSVSTEGDVNGDGKIGAEEVFYILQKVSGRR